MGNIKEGRTTVYNRITSKEKLEQVNEDNLQLEEDFLEYLSSTDSSKGTIKQYKANLHVFWCWNLEYNKNKFFVDLAKREVAKFQNHALNEWGWSPKRVRTVKATLSSLSNYIENILDDEYVGYKPIINKIKSPANNVVRKKTVLTDDDLQRLLDTLVENKQYEKACFVSLAQNSGRRKAELVNFKVSYFTDENTICEGAFYKTPEKMRTKGHGAQGKMLYLYVLKKPFQHYLNLWLKKRKELKINSDWLFPRKENGKWVDKPLKTTTIDSWAVTFSNILGANFYIHTLRHQFCTMLVGKGIPDSVIQNIIGWDSGDMVRLYDDTESDKQFEKYFGADGFKEVKKTKLQDL